VDEFFSALTAPLSWRPLAGADGLFALQHELSRTMSARPNTGLCKAALAYWSFGRELQIMERQGKGDNSAASSRRRFAQAARPVQVICLEVTMASGHIERLFREVV
jgi:hypothetical protein